MKPRRVLVAPLDWGLGHATRCIPIIRLLLEKDFEVLLGGNGHSLELLQNEFPSLKRIELPAYGPLYPSSGPMVLSMVLQLPKFMQAIRNEHESLQSIIHSCDLDCVISDNRYGLWSPKVRSIFITHQLNLIMPQGLGWAGPIVNYFNRKQINKFSACWVPDFPDRFLSGSLSQKPGNNVNYIGPLSRFSSPSLIGKKYNFLILLSGPEPQRSILESMLIEKISIIGLDKRILLVRGVKGDTTRKILERVEVVDFLATDELQKVMEESELVICRSGYSTVMDLAKLGKKVLFIPTPGQTEQEYLAARLKKKGIAYFVKQSEIDLNTILVEALQYAGFHGLDFDNVYLRKEIDVQLKGNVID